MLQLTEATWMAIIATERSRERSFADSVEMTGCDVPDNLQRNILSELSRFDQRGRQTGGTRPSLWSRVQRLFAAAALVALSACGGGDQKPVESHPLVSATVVSQESLPQGSPLRLANPPRASSAVVQAIDATVFMDWAEIRFPQYFPSTQRNRTVAPYIYRYYPETGVYLGVEGSTVRVLGGPFGLAAITVGTFAQFACDVFPEQCVVPVANAGPTQNVVTGALVTLDGRASSDGNNDQLSFAWTMTGKPVGSAAALTGAMSATPTFRADVAGTYTFLLTVSDGRNSSTGTVTVKATGAVVLPVAVASGSQSVFAGTTVTLNGSGSYHPASLPLTYWWSFTSKPLGSTAVLNGASSATPSFTPDSAGVYVVSLVVSDGTVNSLAASVSVTALAVSIAPTTPTRTCCRVCTTGKACGDSCISRTFTCRQGVGCAC